MMWDAMFCLLNVFDIKMTHGDLVTRLLSSDSCAVLHLIIIQLFIHLWQKHVCVDSILFLFPVMLLLLPIHDP